MENVNIELGKHTPGLTDTIRENKNLFTSMLGEPEIEFRIQKFYCPSKGV